MKQYGTAPGQNNYTPDFLQHFDQKDGGKIIMLKTLKISKLMLLFSRTGCLSGWRRFPAPVSLSPATTVTTTATTAGPCIITTQRMDEFC